MTIKGDRLVASQLLEAVGQKNQIGTKSRQAHFPRSDVFDVARINIHIMPALQKRLLVEMLEERPYCCDVSN